MMDKVKIQITEEEWAETAQDTREKILALMKQCGYDTKALEVLEEEVREQTIEDVYSQFYGDEE